MARRKHLFGMNPLLVLGILTVGAVIIIFNPSFGLFPTERDPDYVPIEYTPEEIEAQNKTTKKILMAFSWTFLIIALLLAGVSPWFFWGLSAGILIKR